MPLDCRSLVTWAPIPLSCTSIRSESPNLVLLISTLQAAELLPEPMMNCILDERLKAHIGHHRLQQFGLHLDLNLQPVLESHVFDR